MTFISSEEQVATYISQAFPAADLTTTGEGRDKVFEIALDGKVLFRIDNVGTETFFPTRGSGKMTWSGVMEGTPKTLAEYMVPECNEIRNIRVIVFQAVASELDIEKFVAGGRGKGINDPEIKCINCGWEGFKEDVRFTRKIREKREE